MHQNAPLRRIHERPMTTGFRHILKDLARPEPPQGLFEAVMGRIAWEKQALGLKRRVALFGSTCVALLAALAWTFKSLWNALAGSGTLQFLSLAFSDTRVVLENIGSFAYSVFETLPTGRIAALLMVTLCLMLAARALIRNARGAFGRHALNF